MSSSPSEVRPAPHTPERTLQMSVANMTFMVDRLGSDCAPGQFIRELTENAIAAVDGTDARTGDIIWDVDWNTHAVTGRYKLCVIDSGIGMTGEEMVHYINKLSSSVHQQSNTSNFGVGAKISAAPLNHHGILYLSWKDGRGSMIHLWRDPVANVYGLKQFERPDGTYDYWAAVKDTVKPDAIKQHGTMVVLLGNSEEQNTLEPPAGVPMPAKWILRYLNSRYFRFPKGVKVKIREGHALPRNDKHNFLRLAEGMAAWLEKNSELSGTQSLTGATAHWWVMKQDVDVNAGHFTPPGHTAALFQDELYDLATGRAGVARLQSFGIIFGTNRVVLYVEPDTTAHAIEANTARTSLSMDGEPLPWLEWASEFREQLPARLRQFVEEVGAKSASTDHRQSIRERLKAILELFRLTKYRPNRNGTVTMDPDAALGGNPSDDTAVTPRTATSSPGGKRGGGAGSIYGLFLAAAGEPAEEVAVKGEPDRKWVTLADGTRTPGDLDDRAAKFMPQQNLLLINGDFRVFTDMIRYWSEKYEATTGAALVVQEIVREWFEQQLVEAIIGAQALRDSREWSMTDLEQLWSPEALTAVVVPRYHVNLAVGRTLGARLGSLRERTA